MPGCSSAGCRAARSRVPHRSLRRARRVRMERPSARLRRSAVSDRRGRKIAAELGFRHAGTQLGKRWRQREVGQRLERAVHVDAAIHQKRAAEGAQIGNGLVAGLERRRSIAARLRGQAYRRLPRTPRCRAPCLGDEGRGGSDHHFLVAELPAGGDSARSSRAAVCPRSLRTARNPPPCLAALRRRRAWLGGRRGAD